jgi:hypothetical protein
LNGTCAKNSIHLIVTELKFMPTIFVNYGIIHKQWTRFVATKLVYFKIDADGNVFWLKPHRTNVIPDNYFDYVI